jgi:hypothetical protein
MRSRRHWRGWTGLRSAGFEAHLLRLKREALVAISPERAAEAEACYEHALAVARDQGPRVGAARGINLARLWCNQASAPRPARSDLRLVHRKLRHRRSEGRQGAAPRACMSGARSGA